MKLSDYITKITSEKNETTIGIETSIENRPALLLSVQEIDNEDMLCCGEDDDETDAPEKLARLTVLCERSDIDEDLSDCDEEDEDDFPVYEGIATRRDVLMDELNDDFEPATDALMIGGRNYEVMSYDSEDPDFCSYPSMRTVIEMAEAGIISSSWLERDIDELSVMTYDMPPEVLDIDWSAVSYIEDIPEVLDETGRIGSVMQLACGRYDIPVSTIVQKDDGDLVPLKIYGAYPLEIDDEENMQHGGRSPFIIEYSTDVDMEFYFYLPEYLEEPCSYDGDTCIAVFGSDDTPAGHRLCFAGSVPEDYAPGENIIVELFSYRKSGY